MLPPSKGIIATQSFTWAHKQPKDFEQDSFGATAGFIKEKTEVQIIKHWEVDLKKGPMQNQRVSMLKVRCNDENGKRITGWVLANVVLIGKAALKQRISLEKE